MVAVVVLETLLSLLERPKAVRVGRTRLMTLRTGRGEAVAVPVAIRTM